MRCLLCLCLFLVTVPAVGQSQQSFAYQFALDGQQQTLQFDISKEVLSGHFRNFRRFEPRLIEAQLWRDFKEHTSAYPAVQLRQGPPGQRLQFTLQGKDNQLVTRLRQELQQLSVTRLQYYLEQEFYYQQKLPSGPQVIIPDHLRIMQQSLSDIAPVATAIKQQLPNASTRDYIAFISSWLQQIPYSSLEDRSNGAGFSPPLKLLRENRGDCDSKAVVLAALIRLLSPDTKIVILYLPKHAMLGIEVPQEQLQQADETVTLQGTRYLLADATGPANLKPGEIAPHYRIYTRNGFLAWRQLSVPEN